MEFNNKIGPMVCMTINKIIKIDQKHSMLYYGIYLREAIMYATNLHAFKVIRNGKELYLPPFMLKKDDEIWIDQSAFMADGSLIFKESRIEG